VQPHTPIRESALWVALAVAAILWLLLLQVTHFNAVTVGLGLLVFVGVIG
jgi:hypothetical protein